MSLRCQGQPSELSLDELRESVSAIPKIGVHINTPYFMTLLASGYRQLGRIEDGLEVLDDARASSDGRGEHWWLAEVHRLRGELLLSLSDETRMRRKPVCMRRSMLPLSGGQIT